MQDKTDKRAHPGTAIQRSWRQCVAAALVGLVFGVSTGLGRANELSTKEAGVAQKLYTAKCAKCHKFYDPKDYDDETWGLWMQKMGKKSKLKADQVDLLSRYIETNLRTTRKAEISPK